MNRDCRLGKAGVALCARPATLVAPYRLFWLRYVGTFTLRPTGIGHQQLQQMVTTSPWPFAPVRRMLAPRAVDAINPDVWVNDDTGFVKDGRSSPGIARQHSGTLGKTENCQIGVSIQAATDQASCALNWQLFIPSAWDDSLADTN